MESIDFHKGSPQGDLEGFEESLTSGTQILAQEWGLEGLWA